MYVHLLLCSAILGKPYKSIVISKNNNNNNNIIYVIQWAVTSKTKVCTLLACSTLSVNIKG